MRYFPIFLDTEKMNVLVCGGGRAAWLKVKELMRTEALVTVVAKEICPEIVEASRKNHLIKLSYEDLKDINFADNFYQIAFLCTGDTALENMLHLNLQMDDTLVMRSGLRQNSDFITGSVAEYGTITVGTCTGGMSPTASMMIADEIDKLLTTSGIVERAEMMGYIRALLMKLKKEGRWFGDTAQFMKGMAKLDMAGLERALIALKEKSEEENLENPESPESTEGAENEDKSRDQGQQPGDDTDAPGR